MRKVYMCARMPHGNNYIGGLASIVNHYIENKNCFFDNDFIVEKFDYILADRFDKLNSWAKNIVYGFKQCQALIKKNRKEKIDVLHIHTSRDFLFFKDVLVAKRLKKRGAKVVLTIHVGDIGTVFNRIRFAEEYIIKQLNGYVDAVLFMSNEIREQFISNGLNPGIAKTLYNFWDFPVKPHKSRTEGRLRLIYIGSINREKGIAELFDAVERCDNVWLDICGTVIEPDFNEFFEKRCAELKDKVKHHGYINDTEKADFLSGADVLVLPSYREGFPLVTLEACAAGCAMILTPVGAIKEIYNDDNAVIIERKSSSSIEKAINDLNYSPDKITKMGQINKNLAENFSVESHINKLCDIYKVI